MDDQPMSQPVAPAQPMQQPAESHSPTSVWYAVLALVVLGLGALYYYMQSPTTDNGSQAVTEEAQAPALSEGNTTADISADLTQLEGASAELGTDAAAVEGAVQGL